MNKKITVSELWVEPADENILPPLRESGNEMIDTISNYMRTRKNITAIEIRQAFNLSAVSMNIIMEHITGLRLSAWMAQIRILDAKWILLHSLKQNKDVAKFLGYNSYNNFYNYFTRYTGTTPTAFRHSNRTKENKTVFKLINGETLIL